MTRKRSSYRPRPILRDTMAWVKESLTPISETGDQNVTLRLRNHIAFNAVLTGTATVADLDILIAVSNMATALTRQHGVDWQEEIRAAADAIEDIQKRYYKWHKVQATPAELNAVALLLEIHDAQLDASRIMDLDKALQIAKQKVREMQT